MAEKEWDREVHELNLASKWLAIERARVEAVEISLAAQFTHLDESLAKNDKLHLLLVKLQS